MKLYYSRNLNPRVAVAVARHLGSPVDYVAASPRDPLHEEAFRAINPNTLVPVLVEPDRTYWETDAIACRLSTLAGSDFWRVGEAQAAMVMWISWGTHNLTKAADVLYWWNVVSPTFQTKRPPPAIIAEALADFRSSAAILDAHLNGRTWLFDGRMSYADFRVASALPFADAAELPLAEFPRVKRWHDQLLALDAWREPFANLP